jgi:hypothetical protein
LLLKSTLPSWYSQCGHSGWKIYHTGFKLFGRGVGTPAQRQFYVAAPQSYSSYSVYVVFILNANAKASEPMSQSKSELKWYDVTIHHR